MVGPDVIWGAKEAGPRWNLRAEGTLWAKTQSLEEPDLSEG